VTGIAT